MRTSRIRTAALAATTAALALATLTACGSSDGGDDAKGGAKRGGAVVSDKADGGTSGGSGSAEGATVDAAKGSGSSEGTTVGASKGNGSSGAGKGTSAGAGQGAKASSAGVRACDGQEISYSVVHRFAKQRGEHLLITATNADSKPCYVTSFPSVMLGDTVSVLPHSTKDNPGGGKALTLKPGGKVYAAVNLFTDSARTHTSSDLSIALQDHTGDTGPGVGQEAFDAKGVPSKFTWSTADVTNWNTAKPYNF
ncbi:DUF4232 domain-containing protein [Streptomyces flavofungini]|uniref:DUF4232 domain-containing protein n=1 Tax=Streptomyces flavofungini TaxID=68200 RepID=A0ABS0WX87_9ACTN|nr:DUF4232 domain-containing protein [Streptomyces flavofungini]MBJ3805547.1 DUF4232 domain-containing protein [Streptomyces flavofungini]GHC73244.1 hypothetical protein GCM10010349_50820 [Streptomyces flavofungini]